MADAESGLQSSLISAVFNLYGDSWDTKSARPGYSWSRAFVGQRLGAELVGASLYELGPGERSWPYHYEYGNEEWLIVVSGRAVLRAPDGERELEPGDVVCFPEGPDGAHQVANRSDEPVRLLLVSTLNTPAVAVYPDSDKVGIWPGSGGDALILPQGSSVEYWEGED